MPADSLAAALTAGGSGAETNPFLLQYQPEIQLAQGMMGQGFSTAPASPAQALARALTGAIGAGIQRSTVGDLAKAISNSAATAADAFPKDSIAYKLGHSKDPNIQAQFYSNFGKLATLQQEAERQPKSDLGRLIADAQERARLGDTAGMDALQRAVTGKTIAEGTGVQLPPTPVTGGQQPPAIAPPPAATPPQGGMPQVAPRSPLPASAVQQPETTPPPTTQAQLPAAIAAAKGVQAEAEAAGKGRADFPSFQQPPQGNGPGFTEPMPVPNRPGVEIPPVNNQAAVPRDPGVIGKKLEEWNKTTTGWTNAQAPAQLAVQRLETISHAFKAVQTGTLTSQRANLAAALQTAHLPGLAEVVLNGDPAQMQLAIHENISETLSELKAANPRFSQAEFRVLSVNKEHPDLLPAANYQMLSEDLGHLRQTMDVPNTWAAATKNGWKDPQSYETEFLKQNPLKEYVALEKERIGPLKGMEEKAAVQLPSHIPAVEQRKPGIYATGTSRGDLYWDGKAWHPSTAAPPK